jgi:hypothetical protein
VTAIPDYLSPITGYRVWQWDRAGLRSLNGETWRPGEPLEARCRFSEFGHWRRNGANLRPHDAPHLKCTCGIYAIKSLEHLRRPGYQRSLIYGQVLLWETIVEHQRGWRSQYAYPQTFLLPAQVLPVRLMEIETRLKSLISYDRDIFILHHGAMFTLWKNDSGLAAAGLDYVTDRASKWYIQPSQRSAIKLGDRIAVVGEGLAVVDEIDGTCIRVKLGNKTMLRIVHKQVSWNKQNLRWETFQASICAYPFKHSEPVPVVPAINDSPIHDSRDRDSGNSHALTVAASQRRNT